MTVSEAIAELRRWPLDAELVMMKITVKTSKNGRSTLDYSAARNKRLGI